MIARPEVLPGLIRESSLPPLHRLVLLTLDAILRAGLPDPKTAEVARFCGVGHRTVRAALVALRDTGLVAEVGRPSRWHLNQLDLARRPHGSRSS